MRSTHELLMNEEGQQEDDTWDVDICWGKWPGAQLASVPLACG